MILRRADCGHYIQADVAPAGTHVGSEQDVYLCSECEARARRGNVTQTRSTGPAVTIKAGQTREGDGKQKGRA